MQLGKREVGIGSFHIDETGILDEGTVQLYGYDYGDAACGGDYVCSYCILFAFCVEYVYCVCAKLRPLQESKEREVELKEWTIDLHLYCHDEGRKEGRKASGQGGGGGAVYIRYIS